MAGSAGGSRCRAAEKYRGSRGPHGPSLGRQAPRRPAGSRTIVHGGLAVHENAVVVDLTRIDHVTINAEDRVAIVGAGATWESVATALKSHGLKSLQPSPISGAFSTVGGLASQSLPAGTDGILGLTVVMADGTVLRTGAGASGLRSGPDLTGLFIGDCGAFGLKTEVVIRLGPIQPAAFATFEFERAETLLDCLLKCAREGVVSRAIALDRSKSEQAKDVDMGEAVATSAAMLRGSALVGEAVKNAAKLMGFAASRKAPKPWSLHVTIKSRHHRPRQRNWNAFAKSAVAPPSRHPMSCRARSTQNRTRSGDWSDPTVSAGSRCMGFSHPRRRAPR